MRKGQIALYLVLVLVGICVLMLTNVGIFLSVRAKNRAMNAADAAALAVAKCQGELLNRVGAANIAHLKAALDGDEDMCHDIVVSQMQDVFLGPFDAIRLGNEAAQANGAENAETMAGIFREHADEVRSDYATNPDLYKAPWDRITGDVAEGCDWATYAARLENALASGLCAGPENCEFVGEYSCFPLLAREFYNAIEGQTWCWFKAYDHMELLNLETSEMPNPFVGEASVQWDCEVYPLHVTFNSWRERGIPFNATWTNVIMKLTGCTEEQIADAPLLTNNMQVWAFYDAKWRDWYEIDTEGNAYNRGHGFPLVGKVKPLYNVRGCQAQCRVEMDYFNTLDEATQTVVYKPMAKPFGSVENLDGESDRVTALLRLVTPAFETTRLIPVATTGWDDPCSSDAAWRRHVKHLRDGLNEPSCRYCRDLLKWNDPNFRQRGIDWLRDHECEISEPGESQWGGAQYGY